MSLPCCRPQCCIEEPSRPVVCSTESALFSIGSGLGNLTHVTFEEKSLLYTSIVVTVKKTASIGLNFFALQVNFDNDTWAHGGLQDLEDNTTATRKRMVNWGGLVNRGGGSTDYAGVSDVDDLEKLQVVTHSGVYPWKNDVKYQYIVKRGANITLPPGSYRLFPDKPLVNIDHERRMWEWFFTVKPVCEPGEEFTALIYNTSGAIVWWTVWNEAGYGSTSNDQLTDWRSPLFRTVSGGVNGPLLQPKTWNRF